MRRFAAIILALFLLSGCATPVRQVDDTQPESQPIIQIVPATTEQTSSENPSLLALNVQEVTLEEPGQTILVYNGGDVTPDQIQWESEDASVATVESGVVTAVSRGRTYVSACYEDQMVTCSIVCDLPVLPVFDPEAGERDPMYLPPQEQIVDSEFFDDAVFIGDSQGLALYAMVARSGELGKAKFLARNSYSLYSAATNTMYMTWRGQDYKIENAVAQTGAKKVFIMLGMNDVGNFKTNKIMENYQKVLDRIRQKNPDVQIYIQSIFHAWTGGETKLVNNTAIREFNSRLPAFAEENDCVFIDVATWLLDSTGGTSSQFTSDKYVHINTKGMQVWVQVLKACTDYD